MRASNNKEFEDVQNASLGVLILIELRIPYVLHVHLVELPLRLARLFAQNAPLVKLGQTQHQSANRAR
jgi:hypothetical protein